LKTLDRSELRRCRYTRRSSPSFGVDNKFENISTFLPLNMRWANSPPGGTGAILDGISPKMGAFCGIVAICDPANQYWNKPAGTPPNTTVAQLQLEAFTGAEMLPPGTYRLTLRIAAANGRGRAALGHFGPVGPGGQRGLPGRAIRGLLHLEANSGRKFLSGDK